MTSPAGRERCFRLVALGDSITVGVGDTVGPDAVHGPGWAAHLAAVLGVGQFTNLATNGARSRDVADTQLDAALALRPRLATVLVGGNDVLRSDFDARLMLADLHRCVSELCGAGTDVVLVRLPVIGLFELSPRLVRRVMRRRVASINAAVEEVAAAARASDPDAGGPAASSVPCSEATPRSVGCLEIGQPMDRSRGKEPISDQGLSKRPISARGRVVVVDAVHAIAPAGARAWHVDRVHPSPAGHRRLALGVAIALANLDPVYEIAPGEAPAVGQTALAGQATPAGHTSCGARATALAARLPEAPDPPSAWRRLVWLLGAGLPWCVRRGRDFLPGLLRAVVHDLRSERAFTPGGMVTSFADSGLDPRRRIGRS
ncbi:lysophospholipase L1-like esterase [Promicromonospora sp. AC04]|uniref:SGNH/GDSL hydrolase family protein n=1 Tax=Promicromonospora sp. AC04 TaxID=2135723 RepID=UPI000D3574CB|nr:SGNH/GDSL hydrolase family protein [Promicromonospora sp. AC04]PUB27984.1 lysophospholipase L1-like esterase [Promicromonospora sp. AC04]